MDERYPCIMVSLQQRQMARLLLQSGAITQMVEKGAQVIVLAQHDDELSLRTELPAHVILLDAPLQGNRTNVRWYRVFEYLFQTMLPTSSSRAREAWIRETQPLRYLSIRLIKALGARHLAQLWIAARRVFLRPSAAASLLRTYRPDIVVVGTFGKHVEDYALLSSARAQQIRSLCTVISWDKLTTREYVLERPDFVAVWNRINVTEATELHGFSAEQVRATGIPQFDSYAHTQQFISREEFFAAHGLDPQRKLVFVTPQPGHVNRNVGKVVEALARMLHANTLPFPCQVFIRPYPLVYSGKVEGEGTEEDLIAYEKLHPFIHGNRPVISKTGNWGDVSRSESQFLAHVLYHADVVIDFYGTLSIEACMLDTPVIYVDSRAMRDEFDRRAQAGGGVNYNEFTHLQHAIRLGAGRVVHNETELHQALCDFLRDPTLDAEKRREVVSKLCYANDGKSTERLVSAILDAAQGRW